MKQDYDRYSLITESDRFNKNTIPFVKISENELDVYINWISDTNLYSILSNKYYDNPFYDFLLYYANPAYLSEFDIPDDAIIRIPLPFDRAISEYEDAIKNIVK